MNFIVTFVQIFSSLITVISAVGLSGVTEKFQELGIQVNQLQITFGISLTLTILSLVFGKKLKTPSVGRDKKTQIQVGGEKNKQNMS